MGDTCCSVSTTHHRPTSLKRGGEPCSGETDSHLQAVHNARSQVPDNTNPGNDPPDIQASSHHSSPITQG